jgi:catabolite regulation protein CreA
MSSGMNKRWGRQCAENVQGTKNTKISCGKCHKIAFFNTGRLQVSVNLALKTAKFSVRCHKTAFLSLGGDNNAKIWRSGVFNVVLILILNCDQLAKHGNSV